MVFGLLYRSSSVIVGLLVAILLAGCELGGAHTPAAAPAAAGIPAKVLEVAPQRVPIVLEAVGQVQGSKEVEVRARVSGILLKRLYNEGDFVREGSLSSRSTPCPTRSPSPRPTRRSQERARQEQTRARGGPAQGARRGEGDQPEGVRRRDLGAEDVETRRCRRPRRICARPSSTCPIRS